MVARNCLTLRASTLSVLMLTAIEAITTLKQAVRKVLVMVKKKVPMVVRKKLLIMIKQKKTTLKLSLQHLQAVLNCTKSNWQPMGKPVVKQHSEQ
jgi:hypothetical protein